MSTLTAPTHTATSTARRALPLFAMTIGGDLTALAIGTAFGAAMVADSNGTDMTVGPGAVVAASILPLLLAVVVFRLIASRVPTLRRAWTPLVLAAAVLSLGGLTGAADLPTALTLGTMHLLVGAVAAIALPARLGD
jgi:hypothetical protein